MKILSKEEKKLKKQEYKKQLLISDSVKSMPIRSPFEVFSEDCLISEYMLNMDLKRCEKRANRYIYHYNRLLNKKDFLHKRMMNCSSDTRRILFANTEYYSILKETYLYTRAGEYFQNMFKMIGVVSYDKVIPEIEKFEKSVLELSVLVNKLSNILDKIDPNNNTNQFKYNKLIDFKFRIKEAVKSVKYFIKDKIK